MPKKTEAFAACANPTQEDAWRPSAGMETLRRRAALVAQIRRYFAAANVLEVDTPLLMPRGTPDPALHSFFVHPHGDSLGPLSGFLQTSPEFAMKRLLAAGSGDIYQLCHAFRAEESGRLHRAEFSLLEWYRLGFDHHRLMDDVEALVGGLMPSLSFARRSYAGLFRERLDIDPHRATNEELRRAAVRHDIELGSGLLDRAAALDALFTRLFIGEEARNAAMFVYDFPIEHAAYARIAPGPPAVAQRFELIIAGVEIANGYFEVVDAAEQQARHGRENARRRQIGLAEMAPDPCFLAALEHGLPECAGVALGIERLLMMATGSDSLAAVASFDDLMENAQRRQAQGTKSGPT